MSVTQLQTIRQSFIDQLEAGQAPAGYSWPDYQRYLIEQIGELDKLIETASQIDANDDGEIISGAYT